MEKKGEKYTHVMSAGRYRLSVRLSFPIMGLVREPWIDLHRVIQVSVTYITRVGHSVNYDTVS